MNYIIRTINHEEMPILIEMAANEGWNPGLYDADCFFHSDPNGFFVGELDGEIISTKSAVRYHDQFGFMGFYIVKKQFRGLGYGFKIWQHGFNYLKDIPSGMDGVVEQQSNYMKSGYRYAYRQNRYEGIGLRGKTDNSLLNIADISPELLLEYDASVFPAKRNSFLERWVKQPESLTKIAVNNNQVTGYGVVRKCRVGFKIGPLFANDAFIAEKIFLALVEFVDGQEVYLDVPEVNTEGNRLKDKYGMKYVFETARMYNNGKPKDNPNRVFGVTTFELG